MSPGTDQAYRERYFAASAGKSTGQEACVALTTETDGTDAGGLPYRGSGRKSSRAAIGLCGCWRPCAGRRQRSMPCCLLCCAAVQLSCPTCRPCPPHWASLDGGAIEPAVRKRGDNETVHWVCRPVFWTMALFREAAGILRNGAASFLLGDLLLHPATKNGRLRQDYVGDSERGESESA